jgi:hypothetical protein
VREARVEDTRVEDTMVARVEDTRVEDPAPPPSSPSVSIPSPASSPGTEGRVGVVDRKPTAGVEGQGTEVLEELNDEDVGRQGFDNCIAGQEEDPYILDVKNCTLGLGDMTKDTPEDMDRGKKKDIVEDDAEAIKSFDTSKESNQNKNVLEGEVNETKKHKIVKEEKEVNKKKYVDQNKDTVKGEVNETKEQDIVAKQQEVNKKNDIDLLIISKENIVEDDKSPAMMKLELKDVGVGIDEEEKLSARARKIYLMKELFGDDSVVDEVGRVISSRSAPPPLPSHHPLPPPSQVSKG